jgi:hypothetical protein
MPPSPAARDAGPCPSAGWVRAALGACLLLALAPAAGAQPARDDQPAAPSRVAMSADVTVTVGPEDRYYFNYTDYEQNALRLFVVSLGASFAATSWLEAVGEVRVENDHVRVSALFARLRPWKARPLTVSAGRIPPVFGAFSLTRYGSSNPLISRPLAYQYLTTLRPDLVPASTDALLAVRGRGWLVRYPGVDRSLADAGVPLSSTNHWDSGVVAHAEWPRVELSGGVTVGSLSDPQVGDNNDGKQIVARALWRPTAAWTVGASVADGAFLDTEAARGAGAEEDRLPQRALGLDASFDRGHVRVRGEIITASWRMPRVSSPPIARPLDVLASTVEVQYRLTPRLDAAVRSDWMGFSSIVGSLYGGQPTPWDANVSRLEIGAGIRLARRWRLKAVYQHNWRFGATRTSEGYAAAQVSGWL